MTAPQTGPFGSKIATYLQILELGGAILSNPALGLTGAGQIVALIGYAGSLVRDIAVGAGALQDVASWMKRMVAENRGPTDQEWQQLAQSRAGRNLGWDDVRAGL
jgi:hypothetical protein